ncbi:MAG: sulfotransferase family protein [Chloroflexi bacterium]|nr:sulfotransferase family protein [Chloroflexota bacterium]
MNTDTKHPVLVTGAHRSGTTWVGMMLAASGEFAYVSEPLNVWHRPGVMKADVPHWNQYICEDNEAEYLSAFQDTLRLQYLWWEEFKSLRTFKDIGRMMRDSFRFTWGRMAGQRPLLKDPFAVFSAHWFAERLNAQVVITLRHPAAFVSSLKRLGWTFNFQHLLQQPLLLRDWLGPYEEQMRTADKAPDDLINRASLLWSLIYRVVHQMQEQHPDFEVVRHETLSLEPIKEFEKLYSALDIPFTVQAKNTIQKATGAANPSEVSKSNIYATSLDSRANLKNWQKRLSADEISRIRELTEPVASLFYSDGDWS